MDTVPPEVLLHIFDFLDGPAPSETKLHDQPEHDMLRVRPASACPLQMASLVSKAWRVLALPSLFRNVLWRPNVSSLSAFTLNPIPLLRFLVDNRLDRAVVTFTLLVDFLDPVADHHQTTPQIRPADLEWLWDQLFSVVDPLRFTIIARPTTLAALLSRMLFLEDAWSFDIPYHILSLARTARGTIGKSPPDQLAKSLHSRLQISDAENDASTAAQLPVAGPSSPHRRSTATSFAIRSKKPPPCPLFTIRPWISLLLNEGSSTKVYRSYEFYLRRPPSMLGALLGCEEYPNNLPLIPPSVVDFNYVAIFPLSSHFEILLQNLPKLDRLFVQLTPKAGNNILEDKDQMKQVDAADLWMERNTSYSFLMRELTFVPDPQGNWSTLCVFESGDAADKEAWEMAVQFLEGSGVKSWKVEREGVFVKHVEDEEDFDWGGVINSHYGDAYRSETDQVVVRDFHTRLSEVNHRLGRIDPLVWVEAITTRCRRAIDRARRLTLKAETQAEYYGNIIEQMGESDDFYHVDDSQGSDPEHPGSLRRIAFNGVADLPFSSMWMYMEEDIDDPVIGAPNP
ncbi:Uu.00g095690.m01.CDS01 [Anthostomella pinea]|uniref:Uu.00g095690.m01.CDS01 n=1 Tax=Anthostomella pinea TaxID=933095 RepID=A0AAI8VC19_9PEZI|nr:Uu.00g095690.m01.CDS01 [Anthostomella pinea]